MKNLLLILIVWVITQTSALAQSSIEAQLLENCKKELTDISAKKVDIHDIAFNHDGHWLILYGDIGYSYSYIPSPLENLLTKLNSAETTINKAIMLSDTSWALVYNGKEYTAQSLPTDIATDIATAQKNKKIFAALPTKTAKGLLCMALTDL